MNFRPSDRLTSFLMPPSVDEWLPQRHLARFVVEVVDGLDLSAMSKSYRGSGSASYHPAVLLSLLIGHVGIRGAYLRLAGDRVVDPGARARRRRLDPDPRIGFGVCRDPQLEQRVEQG